MLLVLEVWSLNHWIPRDWKRTFWKCVFWVNRSYRGMTTMQWRRKEMGGVGKGETSQSDKTPFMHGYRLFRPTLLASSSSRPLYHFPSTPAMLWPQAICTCHSHCLECSSSRTLHIYPHALHISASLPSHGGLPPLSSIKQQPTLTQNSVCLNLPPPAVLMQFSHCLFS